MPNRREFILQTTIGGSLAASGLRLSRADGKEQQTSAKPLNILIVGGTGFIGPHFVAAAVNRGHKVAVFNRGKTEEDLPEEVERLIGDRNGDFRSLEGRTWDAVLDLSAYVPVWVRSLGQALKHRVKHYTFISTNAVYKNPGANASGTNESSETLSFEGTGDPYAKDGGGGTYGALKVLCEKEAEKQYPGKVLAVRPGYIVGPGDPQKRFTYWVARLERGGEILSPGNPLQPVQFVDVRDVAEWIVRMAESGETGTYNALGPDYLMSMCEMLGGIRGIFSSPSRLNWVAIPWIRGQDIVSSELLDWDIWRFCTEDAISSAKACAKGLVFRPLSTTATDVLNWYKAQPAEERSVAFTRFKKDDSGAWKKIDVSWTEVEQREREVITRWRAHIIRMM